MSAVEVVGWLATITGTVLGLPQLIRLARTRNVDGLSLIAWQAMLAVNVGWTAHGMSIGQLPQIITSALSLVATVPILYFLSRAFGRRFIFVVLPGLLFATGMIAIDHIFGSAAFGGVAIIPAILSNAGQSIELVRAPHVNGVSAAFLSIGIVNQALWLSWALMVPDIGTTVTALTTGALAAFNLAWYILRRFGLQPHFERTPQPTPAATL